jgi:uncharacterized protein YbjT (DUF2867 family)
MTLLPGVVLAVASVMKILITGATGVIGRRLVPLLCQAGHDVAAAARSPDGRADVERHGATTVDVDLFDLRSAAPSPWSMTNQ